MSLMPPGWYDDRRGAVRWWDGTAWTQHTQQQEWPQMPPQAPAQTPSRQGWVLPVVIGSAVLLVLAGLAVLIAFVFGVVNWTNGVVSEERGGVFAAEEGARDAVEDYDEAYQSLDCDLFVDVTSAAFRSSTWQFVDCDDFVSVAGDFVDSSAGYSVYITDVFSNADGSVTVMTEESYVSLLPEEEGEFYTDYYEYTVIFDQGSWVIDGLVDTAGTQ